MLNRIYLFLRWCVIFARELWWANYAVVKLVLSPKLKIKPGFLSVKIRAKSDFEITSYANAITLTPGTISVHVSDDRDTIVIHAIDIGDNPDAVRESCTSALENNILAWTRPAEAEGKSQNQTPAAT